MTKRGYKIVIAGGSGMIGTRLAELLTANHHQVVILTRDRSRKNHSNFAIWQPKNLVAEVKDFQETQVVINLAGAGVMDQSWTSSYKNRILKSRIDAAKTIGYTLQQLTNPPMLISASAIGYYGVHEKIKVFREADFPEGQNFLQEVTGHWETASLEAGQYAKRSLIVRIGIVLSKTGGALSEMQRGFTSAFGSYFAPGSQYYSWIHIDDLCRLMIHFIENKNCHGIYNGVAPNPVTAKAMASAIAKRKFDHKRIIGIPQLIAKIILGERQEVLTESCRVSSEKAEGAGFEFRFNSIDKALDDLLIKN